MGGGVGVAAVGDVVGEVRRGRPVVLLADEEGPGGARRPALVMAAAELATADTVADLLRLGHGVLYLALSSERCDQLGLEPQRRDRDRWPHDLMASIDARDVAGVGVGAADRARTVRAAIDGAASRADFTSPGHVIPLRAADDGTFTRVAHAEAAVDLARIAGLGPAAVLCEALDDRGYAADVGQLARARALKAVSATAVLAHRRETEGVVERVASAALPTVAGGFVAVGFRDRLSGAHHVALVKGDPAAAAAPLVAIEYECRLGTALRATRCDCRARQLAALRRIEADGHGVLLHLTRALSHDSAAAALVSCETYASGPAAAGDPSGAVIARDLLRGLGIARARAFMTPAIPDATFEALGIDIAM